MQAYISRCYYSLYRLPLSTRAKREIRIDLSFKYIYGVHNRYAATAKINNYSHNRNFTQLKTVHEKFLLPLENNQRYTLVFYVCTNIRIVNIV